MSSLPRNKLLPLFDKRVDGVENRSGDRATIKRFFDADEGDAFVEKRYSGTLSGLQKRENKLLFAVMQDTVILAGRPVPLASRISSFHQGIAQTALSEVRITVRWHGFDLDDWAKLLGTAPDSLIFSAEFVLALMRAALKSLQLLHLAGMVHCDVKGDNFCLPFEGLELGAQDARGMLRPDRLKLIDLGLTLSKAFEPGVLPDLGGSRLASKAVPGAGRDRLVDAYADAEQGRMQGFNAIDWRYDLWALGMLFKRWPGFEASLLYGQMRHTRNVYALADELLVFEATPPAASAAAVPAPLPHDALIAQIDALIGSADKAWPFCVPGALAGAARLVAPAAAPTLVAAAAAPLRRPGPQGPVQAAARRAGPVIAGLALAAALALAGGWLWQRPGQAETGGPSALPPLAPITNTAALFAALQHQSTKPGHRVPAKPERTEYAIGEALRFAITSPIDGHLVLLMADTVTGGTQPWPKVRASLQTTIKAGQAVQFPEGLELNTAAPAGSLQWIAVVTPQPVDWAAQFAAGTVNPSLLAAAAASSLGVITVTGEITSHPGGPKLTVLPTGSYLRGSADEKDRYGDEGPVKEVTIHHTLAIGTTEVTRGQFGQFVAEAAYKTDAERGDGCYSWGGSEWKKDAKFNWRSLGFAQTDDHPVACVSWADAQQYIAWLNKKTGLAAKAKDRYRLPSEAEWEYAARGVTQPGQQRSGQQHQRFYWGDDLDDSKICKYANGVDLTSKKQINWTVTSHCEDGHVYTAPVGSFEANAFKLKDMLGNVWEWTQDCYESDYKQAPTDGSAWEPAAQAEGCRRVLRGGGWDSNPGNLRAANRLRVAPDNRNNDSGFRVARTLFTP